MKPDTARHSSRLLVVLAAAWVALSLTIGGWASADERPAVERSATAASSR